MRDNIKNGTKLEFGWNESDSGYYPVVGFMLMRY